MKITSSIEQMRDIVHYWKTQNQTIALIPTLGKIMPEHMALIRRAKTDYDRVVVSMFENPLQFIDEEARKNHKTAFAEGEAICKELDVHQLFTPKEEDIYGGRYCTYVICEEWEDMKSDPELFNYYKGACTLIVKLYQIIQPNAIYVREHKERDARVFRMLSKDLNMDFQVFTLQ